MPVLTRSQVSKMEDAVQQILIQLAEMKAGQDKMEAEMKTGQDKMEAKMDAGQEETKAGLESIKEDIMDKFNEVDKKILEIDDKLKETKETTRDLREEIEALKKTVYDGVTTRVVSAEELQGRKQSLSQVGDSMPFSVAEAMPERILSLQQNRATSFEPKIKVKPPTYDGKTSWSTYLKQFEAAAAANGWSPADKAVALIVALRGEAMNVLQTLSGDQQCDYNYLVSRLEMRYGDRHLQQVYHVQLKSRQQKSGETLQEYEADIARLLRLAYPNAPDSFYEQFAVEAFVDGLRDGETQQALRLARPKTLDDALAHALEFETAKKTSRTQGRVRAVTDEAEEEPLEGMIRRILEEKFPVRPRRTLRCWGCGEVGHRRIDCKKAQSKENKQEN